MCLLLKKVHQEERPYGGEDEMLPTVLGVCSPAGGAVWSFMKCGLAGGSMPRGRL